MINQELFTQVLVKVSFSKENLNENVLEFVKAVKKDKPSAAKGVFIKKVSLSSTMGAGLRIDTGVLIKFLFQVHFFDAQTVLDYGCLDLKFAHTRQTGQPGLLSKPFLIISC